MHKLVVFASGRGSNARSIIEYFEKTGTARVELVVANKVGLGVLELAAEKAFQRWWPMMPLWLLPRF